MITAVYTSPQTDKTCTLDDLYGVIIKERRENAHPEAASIVVGDFNRTNMNEESFA